LLGTNNWGTEDKLLKKKLQKNSKRRNLNRQKNMAKFQMPKDAKIDYKNVTLLQKYLTERGRLVPRRISGITATEQRKLSVAVKRARFLALLISGSVKK